MKPLKQYITEKELSLEYDNKKHIVIAWPERMAEWKKWCRELKEINVNDRNNKYIAVVIDYLKNDIYVEDIHDSNFRYRVSREFREYHEFDIKLEESDLKPLPNNPSDTDLKKDVKKLICFVFNSLPEPSFE